MQKLTELLSSLAGGALDSRLVSIYGPQGLSYARERALRVARGFAERFAAGDGKRSVLLASAPGRAELGGQPHGPPARPRPLRLHRLDALACAGPTAWLHTPLLGGLRRAVRGHRRPLRPGGRRAQGTPPPWCGAWPPA